MPMIAIGIGALAGGGFLGNRSVNSKNDRLTGYGDMFSGLGQYFNNRILDLYDPSRNSILGMLDHGGYTPELVSLLDKVGGIGGGLPALFDPGNNAFGQVTPDLYNQLNAAQRRLDNTTSQLNGVISNNGATGESTAIMSRLLGQQPNENELNFLSNFLLANRGTNAYTDAVQGYGLKALDSGGFVPGLNTAQGVAANIAQSGGVTPYNAAMLSPLLDIINNGGDTQTSNALASRGMALANKDALLPMGLVLSQTQDAVGRTNKNAAEAALRMARARGGDSISLSAGDLAPFADTAAANEADAIQKAMQAQQGLQLQQQGQGLSATTGAGQLANSRLASAISGGADLTGQQASSTNAAVNALANVVNAATNRAGTFGGLGNDVQRIIQGNIGLGMQGQNQSNDNQIDRLMAAFGVNQGQMQNMLGAAGTLNNTNSIFGNYLQNLAQFVGGQQGLNLSAASGLTQAQKDILGLNLGGINSALQNQFNGNQLSQDWSRMFGGLMSAMYGNIPPLVTGISTSNPMAQMLMTGGMGVLGGQGAFGNSGTRNGGGGNGGGIFDSNGGYLGE